MAKESTGSIFSNKAVRVMGAILLFLGIMLCVTLSTIFTTILTVVAVGLIVVGAYMIISGIKTPSTTEDRAKSITVSILLGFLFLALGIILAIYKGSATNIFLIVFGAVITVYGLIILVKYAKTYKEKKSYAFFIIICVMTMLSGISFALLAVNYFATTVAYYYIFGTLISLTGIFDLFYF